MDNATIADQFALLSKLMDIHGEDSFKAKSYSIAAFNIEKLPRQLKDSSPDEIAGIKGIGKAIAAKIHVLLDTGSLPQLEKYIADTPPGVMEMLSIKGLGPKKIATVWKELEIETLGELLYACNENRLTLYKGFGAKTQENIRQSIEFYLQNQGRHLYAEVEAAALALEKELDTLLHPSPVSLTGAFRRNAVIIDELEFITGTDLVKIRSKLNGRPGNPEERDGALYFESPENIKISIRPCREDEFAWNLFASTGSAAFLEKFHAATGNKSFTDCKTEEDIFRQAGLQFIEPCLREGGNEIELARTGKLPELITTPDIKAIIHSHSNWSDGSATLEDMAKACRDQGFEYLVISDHSQVAVYANGLKPDRIQAQHRQVDELNARLAPFKIFKSIESDILNDGSLDYPPEILKTFDLVIASVHSNLKMNEEKAMARLMKAIENPYTTILGHMTGRLLLSRDGFPVDHKKIIDACVENHVVIELNAHPRRLDMDWRWIPYALEKGALISIDPDAHAVEGFADIKYGVLAARKGGLTKEKNLSSFSLQEFEAFLSSRKKARGIF